MNVQPSQCVIKYSTLSYVQSQKISLWYKMYVHTYLHE